MIREALLAALAVVLGCHRASPARVDAGPTWHGTLAVVDHPVPCPIGAERLTVEGTTITVDGSPAGSIAAADAGKRPQKLDEPYSMLRNRRTSKGIPLVTIVRIDRSATAFVAKSVLYSAGFAGSRTLFAVRDKAGGEGCLPVDTALHYDFSLIASPDEDGLHIDARDSSAIAIAWRGGDAAVDDEARASSMNDLRLAIRAKWAARAAHPAARFLHVSNASDLATVLGLIDLVRSTETSPVPVVLSLD